MNRATVTLLLSLGSLCALTASARAAEPAGPRVAINLAGVNYYSEEYPWLDRFQHSMPLMSQQNGQPWGVGEDLTLRPDGYPAFLPANHVAQALWDNPRGFAGGQYVLLYDGAGTVQVGMAASQLSSQPGRLVANLQPGPTRMIVKIAATDPANPVRNLRMVPLAAEADYAGGAPANPWDGDFLDNWQMMAGYRFMDWGRTNNSNVKTWADRTPPDYQTQGGGAGVALEYQLQLANQTRKDPWVCIPHQADDDYVRQAATLIRDSLAPGLSVRVEYSNEVWNGMFAQAQYAKQQGLALGLASDGWMAQLRYYSQRSVEIFDIFTDVFTRDGTDPAGMDRLVRVMASQSANPWVSEQVLGWNNAHEKTDALAIAPYFGETVNNAARAAEIKAMTWDQRIDWAWARHAKALQDMANQAAKARAYGVELFAYEAGQHFVGGSGQENDTTLTAILQELNRRPEMRQMYREYLQGWQGAGGEDIFLFSSAGEFSKWGSWGLMEYQTQPDAQCPKLLGVLDFLARMGDVNADGQANGADIDALRAALAAGSSDPRYDIDDNGVVAPLDLLILIHGPLASLDGDANTDGVVDDRDLSVLLSHWSAADAGWMGGDFNGDGTSDDRDLSILLGRWGDGASAAVPEPTALALLGLAALGLRRR